MAMTMRVRGGVEEAGEQPGSRLYLDLLKRCLVNLIYQDPPIVASPGEDGPSFNLEQRLWGRDFPSQAHAAIGMKRLDNIQRLVEDILRAGVPGDLIETGGLRGGATIFMRGILKAHAVTDRVVWVADLFQGVAAQVGAPSVRGMSRARTLNLQGLPQPLALPRHHSEAFEHLLAQCNRETSLEAVRDHFARYDLLDEQVRFLPGWFHETLPAAPIARLALLRLDGDYYDSTYEALRWLYPKLSVGGYAIVDDYLPFTECRQAVQDYLEANGVRAEIERIDDDGVFWRKEA